MTENFRIRLPGPGIRRRHDSGKPSGQAQLFEDPVQAAIEIRHHRKLEALFLQNPQHRLRVRKDTIRRTSCVVGEEPGEQSLKPICLELHSTPAGGLPHHLPPPGSLGRIAIRLRSVIRRRQRGEHLPERSANLIFANLESSLAERTGINSRDRLREFEEGVGGVEKDGSGQVHGGLGPSSQGRSVFPAKSRFHLQVKDFRDTRSAAQASSARWEWV